MPTLKEEILVTLYGSLYYLLNPYEFCWGNQQYHTNSFYKAVARLEKNGLLRKLRKEEKIYFKLTETGKRIVREHRKSGKNSRRSWDENWRVVIFDVPEKKARSREYLRNYLKSLGFGMVQRSTWITPYDFSKLIDRFATKMKITECIYHMTVTRFQGWDAAELALTFWPLKTINSEYRKLIKKYSFRLNQIEQEMDNTNLSGPDIGKSFLNSLLWDYQTIAARDPQLPIQLLPPEWNQIKAVKFINRVKKNIF
ncbi:MAG: CRISPR-associated endonuclease Cas2 [Candidatus Auribacterota bacterium]|nr:CRISPR-associated endonuclease Cas2 [Candidatus Auribacterota bacterium]